MYGQLTFYERRLESLLRILVEKGVIKREDLEARVAAMREEAKGK
jgi:hypothetical protein